MVGDLIISELENKGIIFMRLQSNTRSYRTEDINELASEVSRILKPYGLSLIVTTSDCEVMSIKELKDYFNKLIRALERLEKT